MSQSENNMLSCQNSAREAAMNQRISNCASKVGAQISILHQDNMFQNTALKIIEKAIIENAKMRALASKRMIKSNTVHSEVPGDLLKARDESDANATDPK